MGVEFSLPTVIVLIRVLPRADVTARRQAGYQVLTRSLLMSHPAGSAFGSGDLLPA